MKKILKKYCGERALDNRENEFREMKKGNFPVSYYAKQFLDKLSLVEHLAPNEKTKIKAYLRGLPAEMKSANRILRVTTVLEAIQESLRMEDDITQAREERWQAGEKMKREEATKPSHPSKTPNDGKRREPHRDPGWCSKCRNRHHGSCHR